MNPAANLRGILVRAVYANGKQYNSVEELRKTIQKAWDGITPENLMKLSRSMPTRVAELFENRGSRTHN
ncbi:hypothetical protein L596_000151 [Steinernema carpocapsae]|uniref:Uncharacterized protein n=1 Tax=Steinernema carpocapsae TaxID=34508 RepID=A0A4U8ULH0_STECR|nr:hypothetical protein L596_000151 [Steinernema carpocapsae]